MDSMLCKTTNHRHPSDVEGMVIKHTAIIHAHQDTIPRLMFQRLRLNGNQSLATHVLPLDDI